MEVEIVSNSKRQILELVHETYIYIPLSLEESAKYAPDTINPAWRIIRKGGTASMC